MTTRRRTTLSVLGSFIMGFVVMVLFIWLAEEYKKAENFFGMCAHGIASAIWVTGIIVGRKAIKARDKLTEKRLWGVMLGIALNSVFLCISLGALGAFAWLTASHHWRQKRTAEVEARALTERLGNPDAVQAELLRIALIQPTNPVTFSKSIP